MLEFETFFIPNPEYPEQSLSEVTHRELSFFVEEKRLEGWIFAGVNGSGFLFSRNGGSLLAEVPDTDGKPFSGYHMDDELKASIEALTASTLASHGFNLERYKTK